MSETPNGAVGSLKFNGKLGRSEDASGNKNIQVGDLDIEVQFPTKEVSIGKVASFSDNNKNITWTLTLNNPGGYATLTDVTDDMFAYAESFTVRPEGAVTLDKDNKKAVINGDYQEYDGQITITYVTLAKDVYQLRDETDKLTNDAYLHVDGEEEPKKKSSQVWFERNNVMATLTKSGTPSYQLADGERGYIEWTINVNRGYDLSLEGYEVSDKELANAIAGSITVNGQSASLTDGKIKLGDYSSAVIKYRTPVTKEDLANGDKEFENSAIVEKPKDSPDPDPDNSGGTVKPTYKKELFTVNKWGEEKATDKSKIVWTITIDANVDGNNGTLDGFKVSDEDFSLITNNTTVNITGTKDGAPVDVQLTGSDANRVISGNADYVTITFERPLKDEEDNARKELSDGQTAIASNTVTVEDPKGGSKKEEGKAELHKLSNSLTKSLLSESSKTVEGDYDLSAGKENEADKILNWEIVIEQYDYFANSEIVDVMITEGSGGRHYISDAQLNAIKVTFQTMDGRTSAALSSGNGFTATKNTENQFTIAFDKDYCANHGYVRAEVHYSTTAETKNVPKGNSATFKNKANDAIPDTDFTFTRTDPSVVPKHSLELGKNWARAEKQTDKPEIKVQLQRFNGSTWEAYPSGNSGEWKDNNDGTFTHKTYNYVTEASTQTLKGTYKFKWNDLPQYSETDKNNVYKYRIVELDASGNVIDNNKFNGDYKVTYNTNGINLNGNSRFDITNTYIKTQIDVEKNWVGDDKEDSERPDVKVKLKKSTDHTNWTETNYTATLNAANGYKYSWENIPGVDENGNDIYYKVEEEKVPNYTASYSDENNAGINSGELTIINTYDKMYIAAQKYWDDGTGATTDIPDGIDSIDLELQWKLKGTGFEPYGEQEHQLKQIGDYQSTTFGNEFDTNVLSSGDKLEFNFIGGQNFSGTINIYSGSVLLHEVNFQMVDYNFIEEYIVPDTNSSEKIKIVVNINEDLTSYFNSKCKIAKKISSDRTDLTYEWLPVNQDGVVAEQHLTKSETGGFTYRWDGLDKTTADGKKIVYRVVEKDVAEGYKVSYAPSGEISSNKTVKITNKKSDTGSSVKKAIYPGLTTSSGNVWDAATDSEHKDITSITSDDLKNWPTRTVNGTEYYIFKWKLNFEGAEYVKFEDKISDGINPYVDAAYGGNISDYGDNNARFDFVVCNGINTNGIASGSWNEWKNAINGTALSDENKTDYDGYFSFDSSKITQANGCAKWEQFKNIQWITYCTAVPKETIDKAVEADGEYTVTNEIKLNDEDEFSPATLEITKSSNSDVPDDKSLIKKGIERNEFAKTPEAQYVINVNPEGKKLTNGGMIDISDIFETVEDEWKTYTKDSYGNKNITGSGTAKGNNLFDVRLSGINVYQVDDAGNWIRKLDSNDYSYLFDSDKVETKNNYTIGEINANIAYGSTAEFQFERTNLPKDLEVTYNISGGIPGQPVNAKHFYAPTDISISASSTYDDDGNATVVLKTNKEFINENLYFTTDNMEKPTVTVTACTVDVSKETKLQLSVPDSMPIQIRYTYEFIVNENTPGATTADIGKKLSDLQAEHNITIKNAASFQTSKGTASAEHTKNNFYVEEASATIEVDKSPTIKKVDVGSDAITLSADFYLAKYDTTTNKWVYVTKATENKDKVNTLTFESDETDNGTVPTGAKLIKVPKEDGFKVVLTNDTLYKLVEVHEPDGYVSLGYNSNASVKGKQPYVYYFMYNGDVTSEILNSINTGVDADNAVSQKDIISVSGTEDIKVKNSNKFSIKAEKEWLGMPHGYEPVSIEVELVWSYLKSSSIPLENNLHELSEMGIENSTKTISANSSGDAFPSVTWDNLPNGYNRKPVYYYVREKSYTLKSGNETITYTLDKKSGKYLDKDGKEGDFEPLYTGNGLNTGKIKQDNKMVSTVHIKNASNLVVKKVWTDSNGEEITDNSKIPLNEIKFNLFGIKEDGKKVELVHEGTISAPDWQTVIDTNILKNDLSEDEKKLSLYERFEIEEVNDINEEVRNIMYGYVISDTYNVVDGSGEITLTNRDKTPANVNVNVNVNKVWSDGNENHTNNSIDVVLIRSNESLTPSKLKELNPDSLPDGITKVEKNGTATLNSSNDWKHTWEDLPYKDDNKNNYYYVLETTAVEGYEVSYSHNGSLSNPVITITNSVPGSFRIEKKWVNSSGNEITENLPDSITVEIYQKLESTDSAVDDTKKIPDNLKIYAEGDSITEGVGSTNSMNYPNQLKGILKNVTMTNAGTSGHKIEEIEESLKYQGLDSTYDIVTLIAGTNNLLNTDDTMEEMEAKLKSLIDSIYSKSGNDVVLFVGNVPRMTALTWPNRSGKYHKIAWDGAPGAAELQKNWDELVSEYNTMVKNLVETEYKNKDIYFVDIYTAVGDKTADGCHPNDAGYTAIANAFYDAINKHYLGDTVTIETPQDIDTLPSDLGTPYRTITLPDESGNWSVNITDLPKQNDNGQNYVYYVKETNIDGWDVTYEHNGLIVDSGKTATITNTKTTEKTSITVNKKWVDASNKDGNRPDSIQLELKRSTNGTDWNTVDVTQPTPTYSDNNNTWTYTYSNLEKYDSNDAPYQYKIVEVVPDEYVVKYDNDGIANENGVISLTNTKSIKVTVNKIWSDDEAHINDSINLEVHRSTNKNDVDDSLPLIMSIKGQKSMQVGGTQTLNVNRTGKITYSSSKTSIATVNENGVVTAIAKGSTIITATCGSEKATIEITVTDKPTVSLENNSITMTLGGSTVKLQPTMSGDNSTEATYSYSVNNGVVAISNDGTITAMTAGTAVITVTATLNGETSTATATVTVGYPDFSVSDVSIPIGGRLTIIDPDNHGGFGYSISGSEKITLDNKTISVASDATTADTATITVKRGEITKTFIVSLEELSSTFELNNSDIKNVTENAPIEFDVSKSINNVNIAFSGYSWDEIHVYFILEDNSKLQVQMGFFDGENWAGNILRADYPTDGLTCLINDDNQQNNSIITQSADFSTTKSIKSMYFSFNNNHEMRSLSYSTSSITCVALFSMTDSYTYLSAEPTIITGKLSEFNNDGVASLTMSYNSSTITDGYWTEILNLPKYDESGKEYYYWVVEDEVSGYTASYSFNGSGDEYFIDASKTEIGTVTVYNHKRESDSVTMPSTGGVGTRRYYIIGMTFMFISMFILARRRKKST
ncbi:MAG: Cna B-type domain-containing protein [Ruminococcus sp.]|nr:Cna B-type domain-containing protein [Ruminococcus sp.]